MCDRLITPKTNHPYPPDKGGQGGFFSVQHEHRGGFVSYNDSLTQKAQSNRKTPSPAEKKLWYEVLQGRRLEGLKFTRQKPLDRYLVDFYCAQLKLAIEVDGDSHAQQVGYDALRTRALKGLGVTVLRYSNRVVLENIEGVYLDLVSKVHVLMKKPPTPPLSGGLSVP